MSQPQTESQWRAMFRETMRDLNKTMAKALVKDIIAEHEAWAKHGRNHLVADEPIVAEGSR